MATFDDRQKAQEAKFAFDAERQFKATARRNKLLGLWAAELMGLNGTDAQAYAAEVIEADFQEAGDEDVLRKVITDLQAKGTTVSEAQTRAKMEEFARLAREQVLAEG